MIIPRISKDSIMLTAVSMLFFIKNLLSKISIIIGIIAYFVNKSRTTLLSSVIHILKYFYHFILLRRHKESVILYASENRKI